MTFFKPAFAALLLVPSLVSANDFPITLTDDRPSEVTVEAAPKKIVTLANFATDMAAALDIKTLGVTTYDGERPLYLGEKAMVGQDLGDLSTPNLELMAKIDPDLTIGMVRYNGPYEEEIEAFSTFLAFSSNSIDMSKEIVAKMGVALGHAEEAAEMNARYSRLFGEINAKTNGEGPSYLFVWHFQDTIYAYQDNLMPAQAISRIGGKNLAGTASVEDAENAFVVLEPEQLLELDPEVIFLFSSHGGAVKHTPLFDRLQAVKNGRAFQVGYQFSQSAGPIARELVLREAAHLLYPEQFGAPDMVDAARATPLKFAK